MLYTRNVFSDLSDHLAVKQASVLTGMRRTGKTTLVRQGKTMGLMGLSSLISGIVVTALSDRFGRKPIIRLIVFIGLFFPLAILFLKGSGLRIPAMFGACFMFGAFPLVLAAIPSETVPGHSVGKTIGLLVAAGEIFGGVLIPFACGSWRTSLGWRRQLAGIHCLV